MNLSVSSFCRRLLPYVRTGKTCTCSQRVPVRGLSHFMSTSSNDVNPEFINRNPRNLEQMGIQKKRKGWKFQYPPIQFYHKIVFDASKKHTTAYVQHTSGKVIITASTKEYAIGKHLYSYTDVSAAINIGRVLAGRCLETGITCAMLTPPEGGESSEKFQSFKQKMEEGGVSFEEPEEVLPPYVPGMDYDDLEAMEDVKRRQDLVLKENPRKFGTKDSFKL